MMSMQTRQRDFSVGTSWNFASYLGMLYETGKSMICLRHAEMREISNQIIDNIDYG